MSIIALPERPEPDRTEERFLELLAAERKEILSRGHIAIRPKDHCRDCAVLWVIEHGMGFREL